MIEQIEKKPVTQEKTGFQDASKKKGIGKKAKAEIQQHTDSDESEESVESGEYDEEEYDAEESSEEEKLEAPKFYFGMP